MDRGILELQMDGEDMYNQYAGLARKSDALLELYGRQARRSEWTSDAPLVRISQMALD